MAYEADLFRQHGGSCLVDQTSIGLGRDPIALRRVSRSSGVHIVMGTGYYTSPYHPPDIASMSEDDVRDRIVYDCEVGVAGGVKAGIIGEVGSRWPMHPDEEKVLRACARGLSRHRCGALHTRRQSPGNHRTDLQRPSDR